LIDEWTPEPLVEPPSETEWSYINKIPVISGYARLEEGLRLTIVQRVLKQSSRMARP